MKILCPACQKEVDIDDRKTKKEDDGLDLRVQCPHLRCETWFIIPRIKQLRRKLMVAQYAVTKNAKGEKIKVRID